MAKKDRGLGPVINHSGLNVKKNHFWMVSIKDVFQSLRSGFEPTMSDFPSSNMYKYNDVTQTYVGNTALKR